MTSESKNGLWVVSREDVCGDVSLLPQGTSIDVAGDIRDFLASSFPKNTYRIVPA